MSVTILPPDEKAVDQTGFWLEPWYRTIHDMMVGINAPVEPIYTVAQLPDPTTVGVSQMVFITDEGGGATLAFSDGTNWRRVTDRAIVSTTPPAAPTPLQLLSYTVGTVPTVTPAGQMIYVSNESGGAVPAFSDGVNWLRVTDRAIVS